MPHLAEPVVIPRATGLSLSTPKWDTPERTMVFVLVIVAVTIMAAIAMLPKTEEKAQVLISQERYEEAAALYEQKQNVARLNPFETYSLAGVYEVLGDTPALVELLETEIALRPRSDWARASLIEIYRTHRSPADEARLLFQNFAASPDAETYRRLIALSRLMGDRASELAALEIARLANLASDEDLIRIDYLRKNLTANAVIWRAPAPASETPSDLETQP